jgi:hypothetical protein
MGFPVEIQPGAMRLSLTQAERIGSGWIWQREVHFGHRQRRQGNTLS